MTTSAYPSKTRVRLIKLAITILIVLTAMFVAGYVKYGLEAGWPAVINRFSQHLFGPILCFLFLTLFIYDYVSIVSFMYGFEESSDEIQWYAQSDVEHKLPREHKIFTYPMGVLICLAFV